jgi:hypothetical protein
MPSPRPVTGSVKVVKATSSMERDVKNIKETGRVLGAKEGSRAKIGAIVEERYNKADKKKVIKINSNMGGLTGTKRLGGGGGFFGLPKNR